MNKYEKILIEKQEELIKYIFYKANYNRPLAEDLFQDLFIKIKLLIDKGKYKEEGTFITWVKFIANNIVIDYYRKLSRHGIRPIQHPLTNHSDKYDTVNELTYWNNRMDTSDNILETMIRAENVERVKLALTKLNPDQLQIIQFREFEGLSYKEIENKIGNNQSKNASRRRYAFKTLKKLLK